MNSTVGWNYRKIEGNSFAGQNESFQLGKEVLGTMAWRTGDEIVLLVWIVFP